MTPVGFLWLIPFFPVLGAVLNGVFGGPIQRRWGKRPVAFLACSVIFISFVLSVAAFLRLLDADPRLLGNKL